MVRAISPVSTLGKRKRMGVKSRNVRRRLYRPINSSIGTNPANLLIHRGIGFPDRFQTRLSWTESVALTGFGTGITQDYVVQMNSPYDPQYAIGGNQPAYFDQLMAVYERGVVIGAKITATFALPSTATVGDGPYIVGIHTSKSGSLPTTDAPTLLSAANTGYKLLGQGDGTKSVTQLYSPKNSMGRSKEDIQMFFTATGNPSFGYYAHCFASPQGTSTAGSVNAVITIEYIVEVFNLNDVVDT